MVLIAFVTVVAFAMLLWALYDQREIHQGFRALALWDRLLWGPLPSPDELRQLAGGTVALLDAARVEAARVAHVPVSLAHTLQEVNTRLAQVEGYLADWRMRLLRCEVPPPVPHLATPRLRMRRLRILGSIERLLCGVFRLPLGTSLLVWSERDRRWMAVSRTEAHTATEIHVAVLRTALWLARRAVTAAPGEPPEHLPARIEAMRADIEVLLRDCVETHTELLRSFAGWRDSLPQPGGAH